MIVQRKFSITGMGSYLPERVISSAELESELSLPNGWMERYLGVKFRHRSTWETGSFMGAEALKAALLDANLQLKDLDCLIGASATFDYIIPNRSSMIKHELKEAEGLDFPCFDINSVCSSFMTAVDYASFLIASGKHKNIAIVSSEIGSKGLNRKEPESYGLIGDGAAAIVLSETEVDAGIEKFLSKTYSDGAMDTVIRGGGNINHPRDVDFDEVLHSFDMNGPKLLRLGKRYVPIFLKEFFENGQSLRDFDWIIPHQASKSGFKLLENLNGGKSANVINILETVGNCIAASIPLALIHAKETKKLKEGQECLMIGTAAGLSVSAMSFRYSKR